MVPTLCAVFAILFACLGFAEPALPGGIKPCKNDAKLNECAKNAANDIIKNLIKGDRKFKIPVMDPLHIERIAVTDSPGKSVSLDLTMNNIDLHGLKNTEFLKSEMDTAKKSIKWTFKTKEVKIISDYEINGKFLVVPITGKGKATIILDEPVFSYSFYYTIEKKNGKEYMVMDKNTLKYEPKNIKVNFENLFNGDKNLGDNVNKMLNENWKELNQQMGPGVASAIRTVVDNMLANILKVTPYNAFFL